eukprot:2161170-Prymnesium_polylepis.1
MSHQSSSIHSSRPKPSCTAISRCSGVSGAHPSSGSSQWRSHGGTSSDVKPATLASVTLSSTAYASTRRVCGTPSPRGFPATR